MAEAINDNPYNVFQRSGDHKLYHQMRTEDPIHCAIGPVTGNRFWFITRYDDCSELIKDQRIGKELRRKLPPELLEQWPKPPPAFETVNKHMLNMDEPNHTRLKALVHKAFTPRIIAEMQPRIQELCDSLLDVIEEKGDLELITDYAGVVPLVVIAELLGVPKDDHDKFRKWTKTIIFNPNQEEVIPAAMEFAMYMNEQIELRQVEPQDDVLTGLVHAEEDGDRLNREELMAMIFLLLAAGHETTVHLIGNGMVALLNNPEQVQLLRDNLDDEKLIHSAIEEMLRYNGPAPQTLLRFAFEDVEIRGKTIKAGDGVFIVLHAANRDPEVFDAPDTFDILRSPNKHLGFGGGMHYCLGAPLARLEGAIAIPSLLRRFPNLKIKDNIRLQYDDRSFHGFKEIPMDF